MLPNLDGSIINPLVAFISGLVTFFASCLLPLVPTYLAYLTGSVIEPGKPYQRWQTLRRAVFFVGGFILTFILVGATLNRFGMYLQPYREFLERLGGILFMIFGLFLLGVGKRSWLQHEFKFAFQDWFKRWPNFNAFIFGVFFSLGWSPCVGPILAVILLWSAQQANMWVGLSLLIWFGLGLGLPFLLTAAAFEWVMPWWHRSEKLGVWSKRIAGGLILLSGILLLLGKFQALGMSLALWLGIDIFSP